MPVLHTHCGHYSLHKTTFVYIYIYGKLLRARVWVCARDVNVWRSPQNRCRAYRNGKSIKWRRLSAQQKPGEQT